MYKALYCAYLMQVKQKIDIESIKQILGDNKDKVKF